METWKSASVVSGGLRPEPTSLELWHLLLGGTGGNCAVSQRQGSGSQQSSCCATVLLSESDSRAGYLINIHLQRNVIGTIQHLFYRIITTRRQPYPSQNCPYYIRSSINLLVRFIYSEAFRGLPRLF